MKIKSLNLENIGLFKSLNISIAPTAEYDSNITILIGNNGAGKTTVLKAITTSLSWFISRLRSEKGNGTHIAELMISENSKSAQVDIEVEYKDKHFKWGITKSKKGKINLKKNYLSDVTELAHIYRELYTNESKINLPLIAFYPVERAVIDIPLRIKQKHSFTQIDGYDNSLNIGVDFRRFFEWFRYREDIENELRKNKKFNIAYEKLDYLSKIENLKEFDFDGLAQSIGELKSVFSDLNDISTTEDKQLKNVKRAIYKFIPEFSELKISRTPRLHMSVRKDNELLNVLQLSQGEKSLMALVGDIARRLAIMNPSLDDPLKGIGVILIDEIDMHLHPSWQQSIISKLKNTFPNCQFIVTTHSPLVINDNKDVLIYSLDSGTLSEVLSQYGNDANMVLLDVMNTTPRNMDIDEKINKLLESIHDKEFEKAENLLGDLENELSKNIDNIDLIKAKLLLRKERLRNEKNK